MKSHLTTLLIAIIVGYLGGISSQFFQYKFISVDRAQEKHNTDIYNPVYTQTASGDLTVQIAQMQGKINELEKQLNEIAQNLISVTGNIEEATKVSTDKTIGQRRPGPPNKNTLVSVGVNPAIADDILRRISQQEFRRMELKNLMRRNASSGALSYRDELRELDQNKISLRSELSDDEYDRYLIASGQHNRVKVSSVMAGSPAESYGIQEEDVILYYGDKKILNQPDMYKATLDGDVGSITNIEILRNGMRMSLTVPRGTLGVRLEAIQIDPAQ